MINFYYVIDQIIHIYLTKIRPFFHTFTCGYCNYPLSWKKTIKKQFIANVVPRYYTINFYDCNKCKYSLVSYNNGSKSNIEYYSTPRYVLCKTRSTITVLSHPDEKSIKTITRYSNHLDFSSPEKLEKRINAILLLSND